MTCKNGNSYCYADTGRCERCRLEAELATLRAALDTHRSCIAENIAEMERAADEIATLRAALAKAEDALLDIYAASTGTREDVDRAWLRAVRVGRQTSDERGKAGAK